MASMMLQAKQAREKELCATGTGGVLRAARESLGLTLMAMSQRVGMPYASWHNAEMEKFRASSAVLLKVGSLLRDGSIAKTAIVAELQRRGPLAEVIRA